MERDVSHQEERRRPLISLIQILLLVVGVLSIWGGIQTMSDSDQTDLVTGFYRLLFGLIFVADGTLLCLAAWALYVKKKWSYPFALLLVGANLLWAVFSLLYRAAGWDAEIVVVILLGLLGLLLFNRKRIITANTPKTIESERATETTINIVHESSITPPVKPAPKRLAFILLLLAAGLGVLNGIGLVIANYLEPSLFGPGGGSSTQAVHVVQMFYSFVMGFGVAVGTWSLRRGRRWSWSVLTVFWVTNWIFGAAPEFGTLIFAAEIAMSAVLLYYLLWVQILIWLDIIFPKKQKGK